MEQFILADLPDEVGSILEGAVQTVTFEEYRLEPFGEELCIVGRTKVTYQGDIYINSPNILFDLFKTINKDLPPDWTRGMLADFIPANEIIKWCHKYGILFEDEYVRKFEIKGIAGYCGFRLSSARYQIARLYNRFLVWRALVNEDTDEFTRLSVNGEFSQMGNLQSAKQFIPYFTGVSPFIMVDFNALHPKLKVCFSSLLSACEYQLILLMTRGQMETRKHLKICGNPTCRNFFWAMDGKEKFCDVCNPRDPVTGKKISKTSKKLYEPKRPPRPTKDKEA